MRDGSQRNCSQSISLGLICFDSWCIARAYPRTVDQERKIVFQFYTFLKHNEYNDVCNLNLSEKIRSNERDRAICSQSAILFLLEWFYSYCLARANPREKIVFSISYIPWISQRLVSVSEVWARKSGFLQFREQTIGIICCGVGFICEVRWWDLAEWRGS